MLTYQGSIGMNWHGPVDTKILWGHKTVSRSKALDLFGERAFAPPAFMPRQEPRMECAILGG